MDLNCRSRNCLISSILFIAIIATTTISAIAIQAISTSNSDSEADNFDNFKEDLFIRPLSDGKLFIKFRFNTLYRSDIKTLRWENKIQLLPLSIAELISISDINSLHFSLTKGNWNYRHWGYPTRPSPPGAQIRAEFSRHNKSVRKSWDRLVNLLDGKFCASLDNANEKTVVALKLAFLENLLENSTKKIYYSNLPEETLCTENLTPWKKLLPCYSNSGLASLLNAESLLKSSFSSLAIDIESWNCKAHDHIVADCQRVRVTQSLSVVFNPLKQFEGRQTWSLIKIFGSSIQRHCPLASSSQIHVDITNLNDKKKLFPLKYSDTELKLQVETSRDTREKRIYASYDVNALLDPANNTSDSLNVGIKQNSLFKHSPLSARPNIPVYFRTNIAGSNAIVATITNQNQEPIVVTYMDIVPQFLRIYLHTLVISTTTGHNIKPNRVNYDISDGKRPSLIEISLTIPASTEVKLFYEFEKVFLRWTEYKPDANKGVLISSASLNVLYCCECGRHLVMPLAAIEPGTGSMELTCNLNEESSIFRLYARPLLIVLPTPDFSMPYNVITLVCSVLVFGFGPIHNLTTTRKPNFSNKMKDKKEQ